MQRKASYTVAVVGASGAVGTEMIEILEERKFPVGELRLLVSARSAGTCISFRDHEVLLHELTAQSFAGVDLALFSAGAEISRKFAPLAVQAGAVVIDNSAAWRMDPKVPLVVSQVNPADLARVRLQALCSQYGWSLWGFIQAATSPIDYDFHGWGMERFEKAEATFRSPELAKLLEDVARG